MQVGWVALAQAVVVGLMQAFQLELVLRGLREDWQPVQVEWIALTHSVMVGLKQLQLDQLELALRDLQEHFRPLQVSRVPLVLAAVGLPQLQQDQQRLYRARALQLKLDQLQLALREHR